MSLQRDDKEVEGKTDEDGVFERVPEQSGHRGGDATARSNKENRHSCLTPYRLLQARTINPEKHSRPDS